MHQSWATSNRGMAGRSGAPGPCRIPAVVREKKVLLGVLSDYPAVVEFSAAGLRDYFDVVGNFRL